MSNRKQDSYGVDLISEVIRIIQHRELTKIEWLSGTDLLFELGISDHDLREIGIDRIPKSIDICGQGLYNPESVIKVLNQRAEKVKKLESSLRIFN